MKNIYALLIVPVFGFYFSSAQVSMLWGLSSSGGGTDSGGTIVKLNINGNNPGVVHSFDSLSYSGFTPKGSLIQALNGNLYGMTEYGGLYESGTIFEYDPFGQIYSKDFDFNYYVDGAYPEGNLIIANDTLYGMTSGGGSNGNNKGTIFSFEPNLKTFAHLFDFNDSVGRYPYGSLMQASDNKLYGLASEGGADSVGTLFRYNPANHTFSVLHNFVKSGGSYPYGSLVQAGNGKLYGMTSEGGLYDAGVIFSFDIADSVYTNVHNFNDTAGKSPLGSLMKANDEQLYGMTSAGGADSSGVIFSFDPYNNAFADLFEFSGANGKSPEGELMQAGTNKLYGTTHFGGSQDAGVIFSLDQTSFPAGYGVLLDFNRVNGQYPTGDLIEIISTGMTESSSSERIQLYPNPAKCDLRIKSTGIIMDEIDIYNVLGERVYSQQYETSSGRNKLKPEASININSLSQGVYFVHVYQGQNKWVGKFVKE